MPTVAELKTVITGNAQQFMQTLQQAGQATLAFSSQIGTNLQKAGQSVSGFFSGGKRQNMGAAIGAIGSGIGGPIGGLLGLAGSGPGMGIAAGIGAGFLGYQAIQMGADSALRLNNESAKLGVGVRYFQNMSLAARSVGLEVGTVTTAMERLRERQTRALGGERASQKFFSSLGLSTNDLRGITAEELMDRSSDAMLRMGTAAERSRAAVQAFGSEGSRLAPVLKDLIGKDQTVIRPDTTAFAADVKASWDDIWTTVGAGAGKIKRFFQGGFSEVARFEDEAYRRDEERKQAAIDKPWIEKAQALEPTLTNPGRAFREAMQNVRNMQPFFSGDEAEQARTARIAESQAATKFTQDMQGLSTPFEDFQRKLKLFAGQAQTPGAYSDDPAENTRLAARQLLSAQSQFLSVAAAGNLAPGADLTSAAGYGIVQQAMYGSDVREQSQKQLLDVIKELPDKLAAAMQKALVSQQGWQTRTTPWEGAN